MKIGSHFNLTKKKIVSIIWTTGLPIFQSKKKIIPEYLGHKKQAVYNFRNFTEIIMLG